MTQTALAKRRNTELATREPTRDTTVLYSPRCDILETEDEFLLFADLPGVGPGDVDVRYDNGTLTIQGKCAPRQQGSAAYLACEYGIGDFYRDFAVNDSIDSEKITAELKQGVLTVHLPKTETVKPKRIAVKTE
jgi:HSP20 family protein